jgi:putative transposase
MLVLEAKMKGRVEQFEALDEAMRTFRFIQNACLRYWMDNSKVSHNDLYKYCKVLADNAEFPWACKLNSQARQAAAERAWSAIARFYDNCKKQNPGKKGYPKFKKYQTLASVEYLGLPLPGSTTTAKNRIQGRRATPSSRSTKLLPALNIR